MGKSIFDSSNIRNENEPETKQEILWGIAFGIVLTIFSLGVVTIWEWLT